MIDNISIRASAPTHVQVGRHLRSIIESKGLLPGERLPTTAELASRWNVSTHSVQRALAEMAAQGLVERRPRAGTFVADRAAALTSDIGFYYLRGRHRQTLAIVEAMHAVVGPHRIDIKLIPFEPDFFDGIDMLADVRARNLKGAIITTLNAESCLVGMKALEAAEFPHVRLDNRYFNDDLRSPLVTEDHEQAMADSIRLLQSHGHQAIGFIGRIFGKYDLKDEIYRAAVADNARYRESWRLVSPRWGSPGDELPGGDQFIYDYLLANPDLTAVIAHHPLQARAVVRHAQSLGYAVPDQLSVICLRDWSSYGVEMVVSAWSVAAERLGELAGNQLLALIAGHESPPLEKVRFQLIDRKTVADACEVRR